MSVMNWDEKYSVGIIKIDDQHKKLIGLVNKLYDAMREGKGKDILISILAETLEYTKYHFETEEAMFEKFSYSLKREHIKEHKDLREKVEKLFKDLEAGKATITIEVFQFLKEWISTHIMQSDQKYKVELAGKIS